jgi:hypothetical protein
VDGLRRAARPDTPVAFPRGANAVPHVDVEPPVAFPPDWTAARVGTRLFTTDKLLLSRASIQESMVIEPDGSIKIGKQKVKASEFRKVGYRRHRSEFVASIGDRSFRLSVEFKHQPVTGYIRATELVIDGTAVPIVDRR